ncbi:SH3 domain-containing protein [Leeia sp. TBRC 13508]|uniref:SH3 domain-containing protein n=1 Tax=Leeia speluncae TaxID=2884804 RepID=A0ABS8D755_9NEIS|nr:SH3 domain-containing protein [Leeia speluncae]MCB6184024.1 SH3 domain-containing protein [Leeia speluncae]
MKKYLATGVAAGLFMLMSAAHADPATIVNKSDLKATPKLDAAAITTLSEKTEVTILTIDGGWAQIKTTDGKQGWIRSNNVRSKTAAANPANVLGALAKTGSSSSAPTTGVKGLNKDDLENASPNFKEVAQLEKYDVSGAEAKRFAQSSKLKAQKVDYLDGGK